MLFRATQSFLHERTTLGGDNVFHVQRGIGRGPDGYSSTPLDPNGGRQGYFRLLRFRPCFMKQIWFQATDE